MRIFHWRSQHRCKCSVSGITSASCIGMHKQLLEQLLKLIVAYKHIMNMLAVFFNYMQCFCSNENKRYMNVHKWMHLPVTVIAPQLSSLFQASTNNKIFSCIYMETKLLAIYAEIPWQENGYRTVICLFSSIMWNDFAMMCNEDHMDVQWFC